MAPGDVPRRRNLIYMYKLRVHRLSLGALAFTSMSGKGSIARAKGIVPICPRRHTVTPHTTSPASPLAKVRPR